MREPASELTAEDAEQAPDFDESTSPESLVRGERTRDDFFDAVRGLDEPATVEAIAELAGHGTDAAREYLDWFDRMGVVTRRTESPATDDRNDEYPTWRRIQELRQRYTPDDLLESETDRDRAFGEAFDADTPEAVSITGYATDTDRSIESVWEDLAAWKTTRRRITLLERALTAGSGGAAGKRTSVRPVTTAGSPSRAATAAHPSTSIDSRRSRSGSRQTIGSNRPTSSRRTHPTTWFAATIRAPIRPASTTPASISAGSRTSTSRYTIVGIERNYTSDRPRLDAP